MGLLFLLFIYFSFLFFFSIWTPIKSYDSVLRGFLESQPAFIMTSTLTLCCIYDP